MQLNYRARLIDYPKWYRYSLRPISAAEIGKMIRMNKLKRDQSVPMPRPYEWNLMRNSHEWLLGQAALNARKDRIR